MDARDGSARERVDRGAPEEGENGNGVGFYQHGENESTASIFEGVEMAHEEVRHTANLRRPSAT